LTLRWQWRPASTLPALLLAASATGAQAQANAWAAQCANGAPAIPAALSTAARANALRRLAWRSAHGNYTALIASEGALAAYDTLLARARQLIALTGDGGGRYAPDSAAMLARLRRVRAGLALAAPPPSVAPDSLPPFAALAPVPDPFDTATVTFGLHALVFADSTPLPPIALCAASQSAHSLLDYLQSPALRAAATAFAQASARWNVYVRDGYSMTLLERLGNSCRLGPVTWLVATTRAPHCADRALPSLGPPIMRTVFVHPSGGLVPVLDSTGAFRTATVMEWYGLIVHQYSGTSLRSYGVSVASEFPDRGRHRIGLLVHTPLGAVGYFEARGGLEGRRGRFTFTADLMGWVPGMKAAARGVQTSALAQRLGAIVNP
jgi:hypothetical protein